MPLVGPVRVLRLLDVAGRVDDAHGVRRAPAYAPAPPPQSLPLLVVRVQVRLTPQSALVADALSVFRALEF